MKTQIAHANTSQHIDDAVEAAVYLLSGGYPVALPTETVYGLAAWATHPDAVLRVFNVKDRPKFDPLIVHLPDAGWLDGVAEIPAGDRPLVDRLVKKFWPGPLTLVLPKKDLIPDVVTGGLETVAVRISSHPIFQSVIQAFGQPLAAPSANRFGRISPTTAQHVAEELGGKIHLIVDGGPAMHGVESTVITLREESIWILRSGPVTADDLRPFAETVAVANRSALPNAPGQMKSHYAPKTPLRLLRQGEQPAPQKGRRAGLLAWCSDDDAKGFDAVEILSRSGDLKAAAASLFAKLRLLDAAGLEQIIAEPVPQEGLGIAINDRLRKAAGNG
ncbi:MAG: L-threonylcarbamoyladenylate synthase [Chthoniobacteraceae bacterium]